MSQDTWYSRDVLESMDKEALLDILEKERGRSTAFATRIEEMEDENDARKDDHKRMTSEYAQLRTRGDDLENLAAHLEDELSGRQLVISNLRAHIRELEIRMREVERRMRDQARSFEAERQVWAASERAYSSRLAKDTKKPSEGQIPILRHSRQSFSGEETEAEEPAEPSDDTEQSEAQQQLESALADANATLKTELALLKTTAERLEKENAAYQVLLGERTLAGKIPLLQAYSSGVREGDKASPGDDAQAESKEDAAEAKEEDTAEHEAARIQEKQDASHADNAHEDDSHADNAHGDTSHADNAHGDTSHADNAHGDTSHADSAHAETSPSPESPSAQIANLQQANEALTWYTTQLLDRLSITDGFERVLTQAPPHSALAPAMTHSGYIGPPIDLTEDLQASQAQQRLRLGHARRQSWRLQPSPLVDSGDAAEPELESTAAGATPTAPAGDSLFGAGVTRKNILGSVSKAFQIGRKQTSAPTPATSTSGAAPAASSYTTPSAPPAGLKPLRLGPSGVSSATAAMTMASFNLQSASAVPGTAGHAMNDARRLDTLEDEDDARQRERLRAELALHGIQSPGSAWTRLPKALNSQGGHVSPVPSSGASSIFKQRRLSGSPVLGYNAEDARTSTASKRQTISSVDEEDESEEDKQEAAAPATGLGVDLGTKTQTQDARDEEPPAENDGS